jgi:hypothetical protein
MSVILRENENHGLMGKVNSKDKSSVVNVSCYSWRNNNYFSDTAHKLHDLEQN